MRSPRLRWAPSPLTSSKPPTLTVAAPPDAAWRSVRRVTLPTVPLASRPAARWKRWTAFAVLAPNVPSVVTLIPTFTSRRWRAWTSAPDTPVRSGRWPSLAAEPVVSAAEMAGRTAGVAASASSASGNTAIRRRHDGGTTELTPSFERLRG